MKKLKVILFILCLYSIGFGQFAEFGFFNTPRFSRVISLGNAHTGLPDDIETVYYNSAGLAKLNYYSAIYSKGQGYIFVINDYSAYNIALLIPTFKNIGIFALSLDHLSFDDNYYNQDLYRLHYARNISENLSVGTSVNYYHLNIVPNDLSGNSFDISLSVLYTFPVTLIPGIINETRIGSQMLNIFDTDVHYSNNINASRKHQSFRAGVSSSFTPRLKRVSNLVPIKLLFVTDAVFYGTRYDFKLWQPNYGIEVELLEILNFRYGRENEKGLKDVYVSSPQHPVKRYGIGVSLPFHKLLSNFEKMEVSLDYSCSDWDKIDESKPFVSDDLPIRESYSIKASIQL